MRCEHRARLLGLRRTAAHLEARVVASIPALASAPLRMKCPGPDFLDVKAVWLTTKVMNRGGGHRAVEALVVDARGDGEQRDGERDADVGYGHRVVA